MEKLKWLVENTNLYISVSGTNTEIISDWGRAKFIDLDNGVVKFSRYETTKRRLGGEMAWGQDIFLRTEIPYKTAKFEIIRNYSQEDGSWQKYKMDEFKGGCWEDLYDYVHEVEKSKHWFERLKKWWRGQKK